LLSAIPESLLATGARDLFLCIYLNASARASPAIRRGSSNSRGNRADPALASSQLIRRDEETPGRKNRPTIFCNSGQQSAETALFARAPPQNKRAVPPDGPYLSQRMVQMRIAYSAALVEPEPVAGATPICR
jgi:hypothetical protein